MKLRKLVRLCEHDRLQPHEWSRYERGVATIPFGCPGGVFLPDDALHDVKWCAYHDAEITDLIAGTCWDNEKRYPCQPVEALILLDALSVRDAE